MADGGSSTGTTLEQQVQWLMGQNQQLTNQVNQLLSASAPAPAPAAAPRDLPKPSKPSKFAGDRGDHTDVETWLFSVETFFAASNLHQDGARIAFAATCLEKTALAWFQYVTHAAAAGAIPAITTWAMFSMALTSRFQPINATRVARDKLLTLSQTGSVAEYAARFQQLLLKVQDLSAEECKHRFVHGLKPSVRRELLFREPTTLADAISTAERVDSVLYQTTSSFASRPPRPIFAGRTNGGGGPQPMELGALDEDSFPDEHSWEESYEQSDVETPDEEFAAMRLKPRQSSARTTRTAPTNKPNVPLQRLTPEQRAECDAKGLCYRCRKEGHSSRDCPRNTFDPPNGPRPGRAGYNRH